MTLLEVTDLEAGYGDVMIVRGASMHVERGEIVTIIGPNGTDHHRVGRRIRDGRSVRPADR